MNLLGQAYAELRSANLPICARLLMDVELKVRDVLDIPGIPVAEQPPERVWAIQVGWRRSGARVWGAWKLGNRRELQLGRLYGTLTS
jgi:hypothetical protein